MSIPSPARRAARARLLSVAAVATFLLSSACSGDDEPSGEASPSESGSSSAPTATQSDAAALVEKGLGQLEKGMDDVAKTTFEEAVAADPENLFAWYNLGVIAQRANQTDAALEAYNEALVIQPDYAPALYNKAILLETTDLDESIQLYRQVIGSDDQLAAAYMRLGFALVHQGETEEGQEFLEQGIALDPAMADIEAPSYE